MNLGFLLKDMRQDFGRSIPIVSIKRTVFEMLASLYHRVV